MKCRQTDGWMDGQTHTDDKKNNPIAIMLKINNKKWSSQADDNTQYMNDMLNITISHVHIISGLAIKILIHLGFCEHLNERRHNSIIFMSGETVRAFYSTTLKSMMI